MSVANINGLTRPVVPYPPQSTPSLDAPKKSFKTGAVFASTISALRERAAPRVSLAKPHVVIVGGGPAGLKRAIDSLLSGNPTTVIEKRSANSGRDNTVALKKATITLLKEFGVYNYLLDNNLIYQGNEDSLSVRLKDLELALKTIIANLSTEQVIFYDSQVVAIDAVGRLTIRNKKSTRAVTPDLLIVADGARSPTAALLGRTRLQVLPKVPVIAAIFQDRHTPITSPLALVKAIGLRVGDVATQIYYTTLFIFKMLLAGEHIFNSSRHILGTIILPTPGQNYLGIALNKQESEVMSANKEKVDACAILLKEAEELGDPVAIEQRKQDLKTAQDTYKNHIKYWSNLSFCFANVLAMYQRILWPQAERQNCACWKPLDIQKTTVFEIGADKADQSSGLHGKTMYLLTGDALATVDPVTGQGCCTALTSSKTSQAVLDGLNAGQDPQVLLRTYDKDMAETIRNIHSESQAARLAYRPDAVTV